MNDAKLLVTGGSGFIGTYAIDRALTAGYVVRNLDFKRPTLDRHLSHWVDVDVRNRDTVLTQVRDFAPDYILHLASDIDVTLRTLDQYRTTVDGTRNLIDAAKQVPDLRRFVHTSTQFVVKPGVAPRDERHLDPYTVYGEAKAEAEKLMWASGLSDWLIMRPTIIWGPYHPSFAHAIWRYVAERKYLHPTSRSPIMRSFGYVENVAAQMIGFLTHQPNRRRTFYLGDGVMDYDVWVDAFAKPMTGKPARRVPAGLLRLMGEAGQVLRTVGLPAPMDRGRYFRMTTSSELDFTPTFDAVGAPAVPFDAGVAKTLAWLADADARIYAGLRERRGILPAASMSGN